MCTGFDANALREHCDPRNGHTCTRDGDSNTELAARPLIVITMDAQTSRGLNSGTTATPISVSVSVPTPAATHHALYHAQDDVQISIGCRRRHEPREFM